MGVRVLAHVEGGELEAERRDRAGGALDPPARDQLAAVLEERLAHELELGQQLPRAHVVAPGLVRPAAASSRRRVLRSFWRTQVSLSR